VGRNCIKITKIWTNKLGRNNNNNLTHKHFFKIKKVKNILKDYKVIYNSYSLLSLII